MTATLERVPSTGTGPPACTGTGPPDVDRLVLEHLASCRNDKTRREYARDLAQWRAWLASTGTGPLDAGQVHVDGWVLAMQQAGAAAGSIRRRVTCVRGWYDRLEYDGWVTRNPAARVKPPREEPRVNYPALEPEHIARMGLIAREEGPRHELAYRLMAINGLRVHEVAGLRAKDLHVGAGGVLIATIRGKRGKVRITTLTGRTAELVEEIKRAAIVGRRASELGPDELDELRLTWAISTLQQAVYRWARAAGIEDLSCHGLRHNAITMALDSGASLRAVSSFAGHADPRTTMIYDLRRREVAGHVATMNTSTIDRATVELQTGATP